MFRTHFMFSFLVGLLFILFFKFDSWFLFLLLVLIFGSLPDIDHSKSWIGRKLRPLSSLVELFFKHRGFFHSIFPVLILFGIFVHYSLIGIAIAVSIGYLGHLFIDALTKKGVSFLYPFSRFRVRGFVKSGGTLENVFFFLLFVMFLYSVWAYLF